MAVQYTPAPNLAGRSGGGPSPLVGMMGAVSHGIDQIRAARAKQALNEAIAKGERNGWKKDDYNRLYKIHPEMAHELWEMNTALDKADHDGKMRGLEFTSGVNDMLGDISAGALEMPPEQREAFIAQHLRVMAQNPQTQPVAQALMEMFSGPDGQPDLSDENLMAALSLAAGVDHAVGIKRLRIEQTHDASEAAKSRQADMEKARLADEFKRFQVQFQRDNRKWSDLGPGEKITRFGEFLQERGVDLRTITMDQVLAMTDPDNRLVSEDLQGNKSVTTPSGQQMIDFPVEQGLPALGAGGIGPDAFVTKDSLTPSKTKGAADVVAPPDAPASQPASALEPTGAPLHLRDAGQTATKATPPSTRSPAPSPIEILKEEIRTHASRRLKAMRSGGEAMKDWKAKDKWLKRKLRAFQDRAGR